MELADAADRRPCCLLPEFRDTGCGDCPWSERAESARPERLRTGRTIELAAGERLRPESAAARRLLTLRRGVMRVIWGLADGRRLITALRYPGDPLEGYAEGGAEVTLEAVTQCSVCSLELEDLWADPERARVIMTRRVQRAQAQGVAAERRQLVMALRRPPARLAWLLLELDARTEHHEADPDRTDTGALRLLLSRREMADALGLTVESVCRALAELEDGGLIRRLDRQHLRICDPRALHELAQGI